MKKILVLVALLAVALIASPAMAKEGVYIGAGLEYDSIVGSDLKDKWEPGGGLNLKLGYNFGSIALEGDWFKTSHTGKNGNVDVDLSGLDINVRISFSQTNDPSQVYLLVGLGGYKIETNQATASGLTEETGGGFNLGGGVEHFFNQQVALNVGLIYRIIEYDKATINGITYTIDPADKGDTLSIQAGLNLYF